MNAQTWVGSLSVEVKPLVWRNKIHYEIRHMSDKRHGNKMQISPKYPRCRMLLLQTRFEHVEYQHGVVL